MGTKEAAASDLGEGLGCPSGHLVQCRPRGQRESEGSAWNRNGGSHRPQVLRVPQDMGPQLSKATCSGTPITPSCDACVL